MRSGFLESARAPYHGAMSRRASLLLRASVIWTAWVWIVLIRNMIISHDPWSFRLIHIGLGIVSLAFAVVTWRITGNTRRFTRSVERERRPQSAQRPESAQTPQSAQRAQTTVAHRLGATVGRRARASIQAPPAKVSAPIPGLPPLEPPD